MWNASTPVRVVSHYIHDTEYPIKSLLTTYYADNSRALEPFPSRSITCKALRADMFIPLCGTPIDSSRINFTRDGPRINIFPNDLKG